MNECVYDRLESFRCLKIRPIDALSLNSSISVDRTRRSASTSISIRKSTLITPRLRFLRPMDYLCFYVSTNLAEKHVQPVIGDFGDFLIAFLEIGAQ